MKAKRKASKPKARTKPTRQELLYAYAEWLRIERNFAMAEAHPDDPTSHKFTASKRAAKVLKAVGAVSAYTIARRTKIKRFRPKTRS